MAMDPNTSLCFEAFTLDDEPEPWRASQVTDVVAELADAGLTPDAEVDAGRWAAATGRRSHGFSGAAGRYTLRLKDSGGWSWDAPFATLMRNRHGNRPEAVTELVAAVRSVLHVVPPYYGCTYSTGQFAPVWARTHHPFRAYSAAAMQFFGHRYLATHHDGWSFPDPPCDAELLAGGQLLVAGRKAFGEHWGAVREIDDYLQRLHVVRRKVLLQPRDPAAPPDPLDEVRSFCHLHVAGRAGPDDLRAGLARLAETDAASLRRKTRAIETLLATRQREGALALLVAWDADHVPAEGVTDAAAARWLHELAAHAHKALGDPPRS
jgi:hypothetical protein